MTRDDDHGADVSDLLDRLAAREDAQSNCMFQLALMLARIAIEPCAEGYRDEAAQAMMDVVRAKPKSNVMRLFGDRQKADHGIRGVLAAI